MEEGMKKINWKTIVAPSFILALSISQIAAGRYADVDGWGECEDLGNGLEKCTISSPPASMIQGLDLDRPLAGEPVPDIAGVSAQLQVPGYDWYMGCSATSGAMIAGYLDRLGYGNFYTGPTDAGVMPTTNSSWATFTDVNSDIYRVCPLTGSRNGWDGRVTRGSSDDYWIQYNSAADDPWITNGWVEHSWGDAIGDYMKTSQSSYGNVDGSTTFVTWAGDPGPMTCADMMTYSVHTIDGTYGRKLFYEARGYTVTDCYARKTDNTIGGGFSFADYKAEIDAGWPVMINLDGHTVVGLGYDTAGSTVIIHDTWDYYTHTMTWGSTYAGMPMQSVSVVHIAPIPAPGPFNKTAPADGGYAATSPTLSWTASSGAAEYHYCYDTIDNGACDGVWQGAGSLTSVALSGLDNNETYYWYVAAYNAGGMISADDSPSWWWSFTARDQTFADVPIDHVFWDYIEAFYDAGITTGCGVSPLIYCPESTVTRAAMAVFLLRAKYGSGYAPPAATHTFADLPVTGKEWQEAWVDQFYLEGITSGCGTGPLIYCPENPVTRAAMAVFILRALEGASYTPPAAGHYFADMPVAGKEWMEPWVDEFYRRGITSGCGVSPLIYCPENPVKRQAMAVFIVRAFEIPLP
jgi:hypothetical protein